MMYEVVSTGRFKKASVPVTMNILTSEEREFLWSTTVGLAAALNLQINNYQSEGCFVDSTQMSELMERTFFGRLNPAEQNFLISLSVFDSFTSSQAARIKNNLLFRFSPVATAGCGCSR